MRLQINSSPADRSLEAAHMHGWELKDSADQKREKYLYRIYTEVFKKNKESKRRKFT